MVFHDISNLIRIFPSIEARSSLFEQIWDHYFKDYKLCFCRDQVLSDDSGRYTDYSEGIFRFDSWICVSQLDKLI